MKKLLAGLTLVAFLVAVGFAVNPVNATTSSMDVKIENIELDKDPVKDKDEDKKSKKATNKKTSSTKDKSKDAACADKKTSCSEQKTSCCSKSKPDKK